MASIKSFRVPVPIVNQREANAIETLNRRYEKLVKSGAMTKIVGNL